MVERLRLLTARERDVLNRVVTGKSNKVIAAELGLSTKTVEVHRAHVMEKLKADSLADLIRLALLASEDDEDDRDPGQPDVARAAARDKGKPAGVCGKVPTSLTFAACVTFRLRSRSDDPLGDR